MSYLEAKAKWFATYWHESIGQKRKYTNEPYINHPESVVNIIKEINASEAMICAAWLHDVVEDTPCNISLILSEFDPVVGGLVHELTDKSRKSDGNRETRKKIDRENLANASNEAQTIKLADLIDNTSSIVMHDINFAKVYLREKELLIDVLTRGDPYLINAASMCLADAKKCLMLR